MFPTTPLAILPPPALPPQESAPEEKDDKQLEIAFPDPPSVAIKLKEGLTQCYPLSPKDRNTDRLPCRLPANTWTRCYGDGCYLRGACTAYCGAYPREETILPLPPYLDYNGLDQFCDELILKEVARIYGYE